MSKYIDADRLEKDGWSIVRIRQASPTEMVYETKKPTDFPAADVVEVRHGHWKHLGGDEWFCTTCGHVITTEGSWEQPWQKYCEECGAKMMSDDEEMSKVSEMEMAYGEYLND